MSRRSKAARVLDLYARVWGGGPGSCGIQRKVIKPADFADLDTLADRLCRFADHYNQTAAPFDWRFTTNDLAAMLDRIGNPTVERLAV